MSGITMAPAGKSGGAGATATLTGASYTYQELNSTSTSCWLKIAADGKLYRGEQDNSNAVYYVYMYDWLTSGSASDCVVNATLVTGTYSAGSAATGSDLALTTDREWKVTSTGVAKACTSAFQIKLAIGGTVLATASIGISADKL